MTSEGFVRASSNNLPTVDMFMIMAFIKDDERFNSAEIRGAKATAATREEYGDSAVGYVEVKREGSICRMQCKVCPEHRVRAKNYSVFLSIDEVEEKIIDVECRDCAASAGGCKHALAFLMWVHRRSDEPSPTDITSYWEKPRLSSVGTSLKFVTAADFLKTTVVQPSSSSDSFSFLLEWTKAAEEENLKGPLLLQYSSAAYEDTFEVPSIYKFLSKFTSEGGAECEDFLKFCTTKMTKSVCTETEKLTRGQSGSPMWHEVRFGRITASKLHELAHCKTADGTLVETIIGAYKVRDNKFMKRGRELEAEVLKCVANRMNRKFSHCGLFTVPPFPIFGASPDGLSQDCVVEVKCPSNDRTMKMYLKDNEVANKYKAQINLQMFCANKKKGLFCVASPDFEVTKNVHIVPVDFDKEFLDVLINSAMENWKKFMYPKLFNCFQ